VIITLYSKPGCHLCEDARDLLDALALAHGFAVNEIDIEADAALLAAYRFEIPVVLLNGEEIARGRLDARAIEKRITSR
jgi:glutaredoxin